MDLIHSTLRVFNEPREIDRNLIQYGVGVLVQALFVLFVQWCFTICAAFSGRELIRPNRCVRWTLFLLIYGFIACWVVTLAENTRITLGIDSLDLTPLGNLTTPETYDAFALALDEVQHMNEWRDGLTTTCLILLLLIGGINEVVVFWSHRLNGIRKTLETVMLFVVIIFCTLQTYVGIMATAAADVCYTDMSLCSITTPNGCQFLTPFCALATNLALSYIAGISGVFLFLVVIILQGFVRYDALPETPQLL
jgi:hypothetical protein